MSNLEAAEGLGTRSYTEGHGEVQDTGLFDGTILNGSLARDLQVRYGPGATVVRKKGPDVRICTNQSAPGASVEDAGLSARLQNELKDGVFLVLNDDGVKVGPKVQLEGPLRASIAHDQRRGDKNHNIRRAGTGNRGSFY